MEKWYIARDIITKHHLFRTNDSIAELNYHYTADQIAEMVFDSEELESIGMTAEEAEEAVDAWLSDWAYDL